MGPSKASAKDAAAAPGDDGDSRLHIHDIREMPSGQDEELAIIFREMRRASDSSTEQLAARFGTSPAMLEALEAGALLALPDWNETARVITAYTGMLGLDSRPVLRRIKAQLAALGGDARPGAAQPVQVRQTGELKAGDAEEQTPPAAQPPPAADTPQQTEARAPAPQPAPPPPASTGPPLPPGASPARQSVPPPPQAPDPRMAAASSAAAPSAPSAAAPAAAPAAPEAVMPRPSGAEPVRPRGRSRAGTVVTWLLLLLLFAGMGMGVRYAVEHPQLVWSTVDTLPDPVPRVLRSVWELVRPEDDAGGNPATPDPTIQKSDKLPDDKPPQGN